MRIECARSAFKWIEDWANVPDTESARTGWSHHGIVVSETGDVISFHQNDRTVLVFNGEGKLKRSWDSGLVEGHGMTLVKDGETEYIWFADNGRKRGPETAYEYSAEVVQTIGRVVKKDLYGKTALELDTPPMDIYLEGDYMPTWAAVNEERNGGNGDVWVTDGYASYHIHRYDKNGNYIGSISGDEGGVGRFNNPHAIFFDTRKSEPELYITDRGAGRVQVYDPDGRFKRSFGNDFFITPSGITVSGDLMVVAELNARLTVLDIDDRFVCYIGDNHEVSDVEGWPNNVDESGSLIRPRLIEEGRFNSPHGIAADAFGNIYVAEWLIGGRHVKLEKLV